MAENLESGEKPWFMNGMEMRILVVGLLCALGSAYVPGTPASNERELAMNELVFLTRDECANTPIMRANVDATLRALKLEPSYAVVDLDALPPTDARRGYPTPTLLYKGADVFGMEQPSPPYLEPT